MFFGGGGIRSGLLSALGYVPYRYYVSTRSSLWEKERKEKRKKEKEKDMTAGQASKGVTKMPLRFERCVCLEGSVWSSFLL